ncbi:MAG: RHS repeat-associated core domain-containing protein, partial [Eubacteriales bacterium]|nr:RHS repeat-associated core domain-containing protein [Eubacteriales bacterium]
MNYLGNNYLFKKNLQGDIIEIWGTADGSSRSDFRKLVTYTYDAWGNITSMVDTTDNWYRVGTANPFRYRGYYYDNESGLYYLQSRYYDPVTGRFLNADKRFDINLQNNNLFAYCLNNPINLIDKNGEAPSYINNQNDNNVKNIKWGLAGNTWANGCGWIAVYNVMLSYSKKITYQYVINGLTLAGGVLGFGKLGADPRGITKYLKSKFWFVYT